jgi:hypothetical protein
VFAWFRIDGQPSTGERLDRLVGGWYGCDVQLLNLRLADLGCFRGGNGVVLTEACTDEVSGSQVQVP